jgi:hypothetical protein
MRARFLVLLTLPASLAAQDRATDPLTGTWSGYIGRSVATPSAAKVVIKYASDGSLTGEVTGPKLTTGDISGGTFNPATGQLKFTVVIRSMSTGEGGNVTFDGRVANDTAQGKMVLGGESGVFQFTREGSAAAAEGIQGDAGEAIKRGFVEVSDWITRAADLVPAERYSYRPVNTVRTYGQLVAHVIDGYNYFCSRGAGKEVEWTDATEKNVTTKAALVAALKKATTECTAAYRSGHAGPLAGNVGHANLHYGNMVTYIRMMNLVPPTS